MYFRNRTFLISMICLSIIGLLYLLQGVAHRTTFRKESAQSNIEIIKDKGVENTPIVDIRTIRFRMSFPNAEFRDFAKKCLNHKTLFWVRTPKEAANIAVVMKPIEDFHSTSMDVQFLLRLLDHTKIPDDYRMEFMLCNRNLNVSDPINFRCVDETPRMVTTITLAESDFKEKSNIDLGTVYFKEVLDVDTLKGECTNMPSISRGTITSS